MKKETERFIAAFARHGNRLSDTAYLNVLVITPSVDKELQSDNFKARFNDTIRFTVTGEFTRRISHMTDWHTNVLVCHDLVVKLKSGSGEIQDELEGVFISLNKWNIIIAHGTRSKLDEK